MFESFLTPWASSFFKKGVQDNTVNTLDSGKPETLEEPRSQALKEPTSSMFNYSHGLPPKPNSNRGAYNGLRRKRGSYGNINMTNVEKDWVKPCSNYDAVVPGSTGASFDGSESSGDLCGLSSNFHEFNIVGKEDSHNSSAGRVRVSEEVKTKQVERPESCSLPCAKELGPGPIPQCLREQVCQSVRSTVARVVRRATGLSLHTVEKWFSLLSHFLELSAEEQLFFIIFLRKYLIHAGPLHDNYDNQRPQKWERVLGVCAYFSVWLTEEVATRTREDLVTLMGPKFAFGREQIQYLITIDWRVYIGYEEYWQTLEMFTFPDDTQRCLRVWEWLGYSSVELTEGLDVHKEVILNNLTGLSALLSSGKKRQPECLSVGENTVQGERRYFRKKTSNATLDTQEEYMESIASCT